MAAHGGDSYYETFGLIAVSGVLGTTKILGTGAFDVSPGASEHLGWKTWLPELDVAPVEELSGCDFVLEVESAGGTLKDAGAAAINDFVLATSVDL